MAAALASLTLFFGYESGDNPGDNPDQAFRFYLSVYPVILLTIGTLVSRLVHVPGWDPQAENDDGARPSALAGVDTGNFVAFVDPSSEQLRYGYVLATGLEIAPVPIPTCWCPHA